MQYKPQLHSDLSKLKFLLKDVFANLEPYDASLELPFEKILDPFEAVDESFEKEIAMVGMIFTLEDFYRVGGLNQIVTYTDYDVNDGSGKLLWD